MSYTPTVLADGDLITAEKMNKLEQGVKNEQVGPTGPTGPAGPAGKTGPAGPKGDPGKPPQKGVDYWIPADQAKLDEAANAGVYRCSLDDHPYKCGVCGAGRSC